MTTSYMPPLNIYSDQIEPLPHLLSKQPCKHGMIHLPCKWCAAEHRAEGVGK